MRMETQIQRSIRRYLTHRGYVAVHVPNGATLRGDEDQRKRQMHNLKLDGLLPGFPDLIVYGKDGRIGHIEVKVEGGRQQPTQKECQGMLEQLGHRYAICRSIDDAAETLSKWGWP